MLESGLLMSTAAVPTKVGRWCFKNEDSVLMEQLIVPLFDLFQHKGHIPCPYSTSKHVVQWRLKHNLQKFGQCSAGSCDEYCYQAIHSNVRTPLATRCQKGWKKHLGAMRTDNNNREASEQVQHLLVHKICSTVLTMVYGVSFDHVYRRKATQDKISGKSNNQYTNSTTLNSSYSHFLTSLFVLSSDTDSHRKEYDMHRGYDECACSNSMCYGKSKCCSNSVCYGQSKCCCTQLFDLQGLCVCGAAVALRGIWGARLIRQSRLLRLGGCWWRRQKLVRFGPIR